MKSTLQFILMCGAMFGEVNAEQVVQIRPFVSIQKPFVTLNDIADLSSTDLPNLIRLMSIPMGRSPAKGEVVLLDRSEIEDWVTRKIGMFARDITWTGASQTRIAIGRNHVDSRKLSAIAHESLDAYLNQSEKKYEITPISVPDWFEVPAGQISYLPRPVSEKNIRDQQIRSRVDIMVDQKLYKSVSVDFRVLTARHSRMNESSSMPVAFTANDKQVEIKQPAVISEVINKEVIAAGQWGVMHANAGGLTLESKVKAMKGGKIGDLVPVQSSDGKSTLNAKVVGVNTLVMVD